MLNGGRPGINGCCVLCRPPVQIPIQCSAEGDLCGSLYDGYLGRRVCRLSPGVYDTGVCLPSVEGDLRCLLNSCEAPPSNCRSSLKRVFAIVGSG